MKRQGISLLEILIAAGVMLVAMVPLWGLMGSSHKQVTLSSDEIRVSQLAAEILEQIENHGWTPSEQDYQINLSSGQKITLGNGANKIEIQISEFPDYLDPNGVLKVSNYPAKPNTLGRIMRLMLDYRPKEQIGKEIKTYELTTFVSEN